jgi:hypothetical protein
VTLYRKIDKVEELVGTSMYLRPHIKAGDVLIADRCKYTITQNAIDCDCGKGVFCPWVKQERNV